MCGVEHANGLPLVLSSRTLRGIEWQARLLREGKASKHPRVQHGLSSDETGRVGALGSRVRPRCSTVPCS